MKAGLNLAERPKNQRELDLFLCAINLGILDLLDYFPKNMWYKDFLICFVWNIKL